MAGSARPLSSRRGLSTLPAVWLIGLGTEGLAYVIVEAAGEEVSPLEMGVALIFLACPFFLVVHTLVILWPLIRGRLQGFAAVWAAAAAGVGLAWLAGRHAGPEITSLVLLYRLLAYLGPGLLALVTATWLLDTWCFRPKQTGLSGANRPHGPRMS